jgi:hypothetical protein
VIAFPAGTRFDLGIPLVRKCTLTDKQMAKPFGPTRPRFVIASRFSYTDRTSLVRSNSTSCT